MEQKSKESKMIQLVDIDEIELCKNIMCDKGKVVTRRMAASGKFILEDCPKCKGRGFLKKEKNNDNL